MWARSVKTLIERNIRHWANMPRFNDVLCWWERQALLSCSQLSQARMIKAQGNWHKRNMQWFQVKQCVDARELKPFGILKKHVFTLCVALSLMLRVKDSLSEGTMAAALVVEATEGNTSESDLSVISQKRLLLQRIDENELVNPELEELDQLSRCKVKSIFA